MGNVGAAIKAHVARSVRSRTEAIILTERGLRLASFLKFYMGVTILLPEPVKVRKFDSKCKFFKMRTMQDL